MVGFVICELFFVIDCVWVVILIGDGWDFDDLIEDMFVFLNEVSVSESFIFCE